RDDLQFVWQLFGYKPGMEAKLRRQRAALFREYLRALEMDFSRICAVLRLLAVEADRDRPDIAASVLRAEFEFARGMLLARLNVLFYRLGVGNVDAVRLLRIFRSMHVELRALVPAGTAA
ncbi:MAG TPA: hypothetical protein VGF16_17225, partial [Bryobacteraceae bacterium]